MVDEEKAVEVIRGMLGRITVPQERAALLLADAALREQIAGQWISVAERLLRDSRPVLVSTDHGAIFRAYYDHVHHCWRTTKTIRITHWQRMPKPPERERTE